jgi:CheY-like chemotaxis protein
MNPSPILYAEDEEDDAFFMRRAFQAANVSRPLIVVPDGQRVLDYCSGSDSYANRDEHPLPCLLLLDLHLPRKSGLEVLQWVRAQPPVSSLPVVVMTSSIQDGDIHRAYLEGANAYLVKPSRPDQLIVLVKAIQRFWLGENGAVGRGQNFAVQPL